MSVLSARDLELFSRKFGKMLGSGIPLLKTLELLQREEGASAMGGIIGHIIEKLREGYTFSGCLGMFPGVFSEVFIAMVKAAEGQGNLDQAMVAIADCLAEGTLSPGQGGCEIDEAAGSSEDQTLQVIRLVNRTISDAVREKLARIVFKPERDHVKLNVVRHSRLEAREVFDHATYDRIVARIKLMSDLDIGESRLPQDGRMLIRIDGETADIRVQLVPTVFGEEALLFLSRPDEVMPPVAAVFPDEAQRRQITGLLQNLPRGVVIFAGPHGSGKTTTRDTAASLLNDGSRVIFEVGRIYRSTPGIGCIQVKPHIGMTMGAAIKAAVRAEPHVLIVEDLIDEETALECFKAADEGILVLTQMHARNTCEVFRQLLNLKVPPFQLYGGIGAVVFQVLVRNICSDCRREIEFSSQDLFRLGLADLKPGRYSESRGCDKCRSSGYRGMHPLYELTVPTKILTEAIIKGDANHIALALEALHGTGLEAKVRAYVEAGNTSPAEFNRIRAILSGQNG